jgi:hypothetical protein
MVDDTGESAALRAAVSPYLHSMRVCRVVGLYWRHWNFQLEAGLSGIGVCETGPEHWQGIILRRP